MTVKTNDNLYLAAGGIALLGSCIWAFLQQSNISSLREPVHAPISGRAYESSPLALTSAESRQWSGPGSQSAGDTWLFDVFTPPVIYYNTDTKKFTVTVPVPRRTDEVTEHIIDPAQPAPYGLELTKVDQPLFRLQLIGNIGEGPDARGNFLNVVTGDVVFGSKGKKIPGLNLEIVSFSAERVRTKVEGGTDTVQTIVKAVVRDTVTGEQIPLDASVPRTEGPIVAEFKQANGALISAKSGDVLTIDGHTFVIGALQTNPPSAVVTKSGGDIGQPETKTLLIPAPSAPAASGTPHPDGSPVQPPAGNVPF